MEKNLTISSVERLASIQMVEVDANFVSRLMKVQYVYPFDQILARDMALILVKDLADGLDILDEGFHNELYHYGILRKDDDVPCEMPEPTCHD